MLEYQTERRGSRIIRMAPYINGISRVSFPKFGHLIHEKIILYKQASLVYLCQIFVFMVQLNLKNAYVFWA